MYRESLFMGKGGGAVLSNLNKKIKRDVFVLNQRKKDGTKKRKTVIAISPCKL